MLEENTAGGSRCNYRIHACRGTSCLVRLCSWNIENEGVINNLGVCVVGRIGIDTVDRTGDCRFVLGLKYGA